MSATHKGPHYMLTNIAALVAARRNQGLTQKQLEAALAAHGVPMSILYTESGRRQTLPAPQRAALAAVLKIEPEQFSSAQPIEPTVPVAETHPEIVDEWIHILPASTGGSGQFRGQPKVELAADGKFYFSRATLALLGEPLRVRIDINPYRERVRFYPATAGDSLAYSVSGGGNAPASISGRKVAIGYPYMIGTYDVRVLPDGGIECHMVRDEEQTIEDSQP